MKPIGIGIDDFREIILTKSFYVDKTKFIEELEKDTSKVQLITRPRRFGKSLNMSMLKYFYNIENRDKNRELFSNLYIEKSPIFSEQGKCPVIFISFKDIKADNLEEMYLQLRRNFSELFDNYKFLRESLDERALEIFDSIWKEKVEGNYSNSLKFLSKCLNDYYSQEIILLIDEYDTPIISAYEYGYYDEIKTFFTTMYGSVLKGNLSLRKAVLTGIMRISKENIFSGLNNIKVNSILERDFSEYFGLTEEEVEQALKEYRIEYKLNEIQTWYNGYNFGGTRVYNPFSITNYLKRKKIMPYWVNTSSNTLINKVLKEANNSIFKELSKLFQGEVIEKIIDIYSNFNELRNTEQIWYLLTNAGYLTIVDEIDFDEYSIRIPNEEIYYFFERDFIKNFIGDRRDFKDILDYFLEGDFENFTYELEKIMLTNVSCFDFDSNADEAYYHVFILGMMLALRREYYVSSNREAGRGRFDLILEPRDKSRNGFVIEFKAPDSEKNLEKESQEALSQIEKNFYDVELKARGVERVYYVGMAFYKREFKLAWKNNL
ncbi:AAA family ATPase [uncultured Fusobacterium sp.]|uniref:AAA family ATPase n=1 Tax=uncultured Fusobacterium sp. TaxID=159267 RepID=UPI0025EEFB02|nr:AAA family ATPase [uncultured Fusobacterium sp.]